MGMFAKTKSESGSQNAPLTEISIEKTPIKSSADGGFGGANGAGVSKSTGKKKTLRGLNLIAARFRRFDEITVDSSDDSDYNGYVPPTNDIALKSRTMGHQTLNPVMERMELPPPPKDRHTPPRNKKSRVMKAMRNGSIIKPNIETVMMFQRLDTAESHDSSSTHSLENVGVEHFPPTAMFPEVSHGLKSEKEQKRYRTPTKKLDASSSLMTDNNIKFSTPQPMNQQAHKDKNGPRSAPSRRTRVECTSATQNGQRSNAANSKKLRDIQNIDNKGFPLSRIILQDEKSEVYGTDNVILTRKEPSPKRNKNPKHHMHAFHKLPSETSPTHIRNSKGASKQRQQMENANHHTLMTCVSEDTFDIRSTTKEDEIDAIHIVELKEAPSMNSDGISYASERTGFLSEENGFPSEHGETEFRQFVFDENFNKIEKVAVAKSDHGQHDFSDLVQAAAMITKKYSRDLVELKKMQAAHQAKTTNHISGKPSFSQSKMTERERIQLTPNRKQFTSNGHIDTLSLDPWRVVTEQQQAMGSMTPTQPKSQASFPNSMFDGELGCSSGKMVHSVPSKWTHSDRNISVNKANARGAVSPQDIFRSHSHHSSSVGSGKGSKGILKNKEQTKGRSFVYGSRSLSQQSLNIDRRDLNGNSAHRTDLNNMEQSRILNDGQRNLKNDFGLGVTSTVASTSSHEGTVSTNPHYQRLNSHDHSSMSLAKSTDPFDRWDHQQNDMLLPFVSNKNDVAVIENPLMKDFVKSSQINGAFPDFSVEDDATIDPFSDNCQHFEPFQRDFMKDDVNSFPIGSAPNSNWDWDIPAFDPFQHTREQTAPSQKKAEDALIESIRHAKDRDIRNGQGPPEMKPDPSPRLSGAQPPPDSGNSETGVEIPVLAPKQTASSDSLVPSALKNDTYVMQLSARTEPGNEVLAQARNEAPVLAPKMAASSNAFTPPALKKDTYLKQSSARTAPLSEVLTNTTSRYKHQAQHRDMSIYLKGNIDKLIKQSTAQRNKRDFDDNGKDGTDDDDSFSRENSKAIKQQPIGPQKLAPKAVPTNAILGSMLFRQTLVTQDAFNTQPTTTNAKNRVAQYNVASDHLKIKVAKDKLGNNENENRNKSFKVPLSVHFDGTESTFSSVTEEASSIYQKTFQPAWTKSAQTFLDSYNVKKNSTNLNDRVQQVTQKMTRLEKEHANMFTSEF